MISRNLLAIILLALASTAHADDFILSYWCGPPESVTNLNKAYAEVAECGFNYTLLPCTGVSDKGNKAILEACKKSKLKYILYDSRIASAEPSSPAFKTNVAAAVAEYGKHTALGGYFIADEPDYTAIARVGAINRALLEADPKHLPFINLYPNYVPAFALAGHTYEQYVEDFLTNARPRLLSFDHYALLDNGTLRPNYFENLEIVRRQGLKHDVPISFIFQLTSHGSYRDPSEEELRWQVNTGLIYGTKALLYFTYWHPPADPVFAKSVAVIGPKGERSYHYAQVKRINAAINVWAPTLMKLKSTGVYHSGDLPLGTQRLPETLLQIKGDGAFIVGTFRHQDGSDWLMIMNRNLHNATTATLHFPQKIKKLQELSSDRGKLHSLKLCDNELPLTLSVGEAKLFKLTFSK